MFLTVSVEWHCPEPSTTTLAKGSGRPVKADSGRWKGKRWAKCADACWITVEIIITKTKRETERRRQTHCSQTGRQSDRQGDRQEDSSQQILGCRFDLFYRYRVLWNFPPSNVSLWSCDTSLLLTVFMTCREMETTTSQLAICWFYSGNSQHGRLKKHVTLSFCIYKKNCQ